MRISYAIVHTVYNAITPAPVSNINTTVIVIVVTRISNIE